MSFIKELKIIRETSVEDDMSDMLNNDLPFGTRQCEGIPINEDYILSIQASSLHYCEPRALLPLEEYTRFEVALVHNKHITSDVSILSGFNKYNELMDYFDGQIFSFVPKELIEDLYSWIKK